MLGQAIALAGDGGMLRGYPPSPPFPPHGSATWDLVMLWLCIPQPRRVSLLSCPQNKSPPIELNPMQWVGEVWGVLGSWMVFEGTDSPMVCGWGWELCPSACVHLGIMENPFWSLVPLISKSRALWGGTD